MVEIQKDVFWKAAVITLIVFSLGVLLGYLLEENRISEIQNEYKQVEMEWADAKLQSVYYYQLLNPEYCDIAIESNINFADKVYQQGLKLERYEKANKLNNEMVYEKQRYALLKLEFWMNSVILKDKCKADYNNVVYFYKDQSSIAENSAQEAQSKILLELKNKYAQKVMLIPLPIDMDIATINIIKDIYNIEKVPTIFINEKIKLENVNSLQEIEKNINL